MQYMAVKKKKMQVGFVNEETKLKEARQIEASCDTTMEDRLNEKKSDADSVVTLTICAREKDCTKEVYKSMLSYNRKGKARSNIIQFDISLGTFMKYYKDIVKVNNSNLNICNYLIHQSLELNADIYYFCKKNDEIISERKMVG